MNKIAFTREVKARLLLGVGCAVGFVVACQVPNSFAARGVSSGECGGVAQVTGFPFATWIFECSLFGMWTWNWHNAMKDFLLWLGLFLILQHALIRLQKRHR